MPTFHLPSEHVTNLLWLEDQSESNRIRNLIEEALKDLEQEGQISLAKETLSGKSNILSILQKYHAKNPLDVVLAPAETHEIIVTFDTRIAVFDLSWIFDDGVPKIFVETHGRGGISYDEYGRINIPGGSDPWESKEYIEILTGFLDGKPSGHLGGRRGSSIRPATVSPAEKFLQEIKDILQNVPKTTPIKNLPKPNPIPPPTIPTITTQQINQLINNLKFDKEKKKDKKPPTTLDDNTGKDFLLILNEIYHSLKMDNLWRNIRKGLLNPEQTDEREEFIYWLNDLKFIKGLGEKIQEGKPFSKEEDTIYGVWFWLYKNTHLEGSRLNHVMYYLWKMGAPIDPVEKPANLNTISLLSGARSQKDDEEKLSLVFI